MARPLRRLLVLDLSATSAGAYCGKLFATFGAEVLLAEPPRRGSEVRWLPPFLNDEAGAERSTLFLYLGSGKKSLTLDAASAAGREILHRLLSTADLLIEDVGKAARRRMGLSSRALAHASPRLVQVSFSPFGPTGPYRRHKTTPLELAALAGWMVQTGEPGREPLVSNSTTMIEFVPGILGAVAGLAAVQASRSSGRGRHVEVPALESLLYATRYYETTYSYTGREIKRQGATLAGSPTYGIFSAADGYVASAASTSSQIELLMQMAGIDSAKFSTREARYERANELIAELGRWFAGQTRDQLFHEAQQWRIPMAKVCAIDELSELEQLRHRGFFQEVDHPLTGRRPYPGVPAKLSKTPAEPTKRAPLLGEHTREILAGRLGYSRREITALVEVGVV